MPTPLSVTALFSTATVAALLDTALAVARVAGLPVTSWRTGDPTRTLLAFLAEVLGDALEPVVVGFAKSAFLSFAEREWLTLVASEVYGVTRVEATYAAGTLTLANGGGGLYEVDPGDLTFRSSATGATYHNATGGTLSAGSTLALDWIADAPGSDSSVLADEIDELVTTLLGVSIASSSASVATDEQGDEALREQCRATRGALSPNGPADAYAYVVRNPALTGGTEITRAAVIGTTGTGVVLVYVAGAAGAVTAGAVTAAQDAVEAWATPLCVQATVVNAEPVAVDVTAVLDAEGLPEGYESLVESRLDAWLGALALGGDVARSRVITEMHNAIPGLRSMTLTAPASDVALGPHQAAVLGTLTLTES